MFSESPPPGASNSDSPRLCPPSERGWTDAEAYMVQVDPHMLDRERRAEHDVNQVDRCPRLVMHRCLLNLHADEDGVDADQDHH